MACNGCSGQELALSKLQGPTGPQGPTGATGPAGATLVYSDTDVASAAGSTTPISSYTLNAGTLSDGEGLRIFTQFEETGTTVPGTDQVYPTINGGGINPNFGWLSGTKFCTVELEAIRTSSTNFRVVQTIRYYNDIFNTEIYSTIATGDMGSADMDLNNIIIGIVADTTNAAAVTLRLVTIQLLTL